MNKIPNRQRRLPHGPLRQLAVPHDGIHPVIPPIQLSRQRHTHAHGQAVAQAAGIHLDAGELVDRVSYVFGAKL